MVNPERGGEYYYHCVEELVEAEIVLRAVRVINGKEERSRGAGMVVRKGTAESTKDPSSNESLHQDISPEQPLLSAFRNPHVQVKKDHRTEQSSEGTDSLVEPKQKQRILGDKLRAVEQYLQHMASQKSRKDYTDYE